MWLTWQQMLGGRIDILLGTAGSEKYRCFVIWHWINFLEFIMDRVTLHEIEMGMYMYNVD